MSSSKCLLAYDDDLLSRSCLPRELHAFTSSNNRGRLLINQLILRSNVYTRQNRKHLHCDRPIYLGNSVRNRAVKLLKQ